MRRTVSIDIIGYWHMGTGRGSGSHVKALTEKDFQGLPIVPGKHLKGLLRNAVDCAAQWGWLSENDIQTLNLAAVSEVVDYIFGERTREEKRYNTLPGKLHVHNAGLETEDAAYLAQPEAVELRHQLYRYVFNTRIDASTGAAQDKSLRGIEVVIPLTLSADIGVIPDGLSAAQVDSIWAILDSALPLIRQVGAHRQRGLGQARLQWRALSSGQEA